MGKLHTIKEIARLLNKHEQTVYRRIDKWSNEQKERYLDTSSKPYRVDIAAFAELDQHQKEFTSYEEITSNVYPGQPSSLEQYLKEEIKELKEYRKELEEKILRLNVEKEVLSSLTSRNELAPHKVKKNNTSTAGTKGQMSDRVFYIIVLSIAALGAIGLYIVEI